VAGSPFGSNNQYANRRVGYGSDRHRGRLGGEERAMSLTGRFWFRKSWTGRLVLLVEEERPRWFARGSGKARWRNAKLMDFAEPELRPLMTMEKHHRTGGASAPVRPLRSVPTAPEVRIANG
jgi:hypothetical protein